MVTTPGIEWGDSPWDRPQEHTIAEADKAEKALQTKFPLGPQLVRLTDRGASPGWSSNADDRQLLLCFMQKFTSESWNCDNLKEVPWFVKHGRVELYVYIYIHTYIYI